ncbi:MAG TPA: hypothetical protein VIV13_02125, partial [Solirubrobacterales bacterium]
AGLEPLQLAAAGGEDYELLATLPAEALTQASARIGEAAEAALTPIGRVSAGEGAEIRLPEGGRLEAAGYDHFSEPSRGSRSAAHERRGG